MWCSTFRTITRENRPNISEFEKEWRTNKVLVRSPKGSRGVFSNFSYIMARGYGIREGERAWVKTLRIDCRMITIHDRKRKRRNPQHTRECLLQAAFREVYRYGFQSAGIDTILAAFSPIRLGRVSPTSVVAEHNRSRWTRPRWFRQSLNQRCSRSMLRSRP